MRGCGRVGLYRQRRQGFVAAGPLRQHQDFERCGFSRSGVGGYAGSLSPGVWCGVRAETRDNHGSAAVVFDFEAGDCVRLGDLLTMNGVLVLAMRVD
jgi:hypothetical protein